MTQALQGYATIDNAIKQAIDDRVITAFNERVSAQENKITLAQKMFKESVNIGEAVVNVLSNTGIAGFKFNIPQREQLKFQSDVTDHYTDSNNAVQDHISQKPVTITLTGLHGDYFYSVNQIEDMLAKVVPTLALVKQFIPKLPDSTKQKLLKKYQNLAITDNTPEALQKSTIKNEVNNIDLFLMFQEIYKITSSQTRAYLFLKALWRSKAIFSLETTFERFDNMVVTDLSPLRDENADQTEFTITFKQLNFAKTITTTAQNSIGRLSAMISPTVNKGVDKGKEVPTI